MLVLLYRKGLEPSLVHVATACTRAVGSEKLLTPFRSRRIRAPRLDRLLFKRGRRIGVECKRMDAPVLTPSMRIALTDLKLDELRVVYPGENSLLDLVAVT